MMIALMAMAMHLGQPAGTMAAPPRIPCTPAIVAANTPAGWRVPIRAASGTAIVPARAASLALGPAATVSFAAPPARSAALGATVVVIVPRAGRWQVSLDAPVWIDVVDARGKVATSVAHGHGPTCSGIAKIVDFDLPAGRYVLQLSGATPAMVRVMIAPA